MVAESMPLHEGRIIHAKPPSGMGGEYPRPMIVASKTSTIISEGKPPQARPLGRAAGAVLRRRRLGDGAGEPQGAGEGRGFDAGKSGDLSREKLRELPRPRRPGLAAHRDAPAHRGRALPDQLPLFIPVQGAWR